MNRATVKTVEKWHRLYWRARLGNDGDRTGYLKTRRNFQAWAARVARVAEALDDPLAPSSVKTIANAYDYIWAEREWSSMPIARVDEFGMALVAAGDPKKLRLVAAEREENKKKRDAEYAARNTPEARLESKRSFTKYLVERVAAHAAEGELTDEDKRALVDQLGRAFQEQPVVANKTVRRKRGGKGAHRG
jgi:hypothetical protein